MDLATVRTKTNETSYMLLLAQWGMIADIDIESEKLRRLGGKVRDTLGALKCIVQRRTYSGLLHYLPVNATEEGQASASEEEQASAPGIQGEKQHQSGIYTTKGYTQKPATLVLVECIIASTRLLCLDKLKKIE